MNEQKLPHGARILVVRLSAIGDVLHVTRRPSSTTSSGSCRTAM